MYNVLKKNPNSREYKEWFLRYRPTENRRNAPGANEERERETKHKKFKKTHRKGRTGKRSFLK
jgi:hypothetical protein